MLTNGHGSIRRCHVKLEFFNNLLSLEDIVDLYCQWRDDDEYFLLEGEVPCIEDIHVGGDSYFYARFPEYYKGGVRSHTIRKWIKMAKRGNDVYRFLVGKRFNDVFEKLPNITFFDEDWGVKETRVLFLTLTYDPNRCDVKEAWCNIGKDWDNFKKRLYKEYGKVSCFRTWESTKHYYPHIHAVVIFTEDKFPVFVHESKKTGKKKFRIAKHDKDKISSFWHSHVDIQGVSNTEGAVHELNKYIIKDLCSHKGDITNSMIWLFGKQSFAISKNFVRLLSNNLVDTKMEDVKTDDLMKQEMANSHLLNVKWRFVGVFRGRDLGVSGHIWVVTMPKPPPRIKKLIREEEKRQDELRSRKARYNK